MTYKTISIIIATFNSEKTLPLTLESVKKQDYPKDKIEILVIDGGSTDCTKKIAKKFGCIILNNSKREPLNAKYLGFMKAKGNYILCLDSDEVMENKKSLINKIKIFNKTERIKVVIPSGYKVPENKSSINYYINELGDPFSFFMYRLSKDFNFFLKEMNYKFKNIYNDSDCTIFNFFKIKNLPFLEFGAMGTIIDLKYFRSTFPQYKNNLYIAAFIFYYLNEKNIDIGLAKNDAIFHYSSDTLAKYLKKIKSRIENNVFKTEMGKGGFLGRDYFQSRMFRLKRFLFIPYSFSVVFPLIDALRLSLSRKRLIYLIHPFLCIYTICLIGYYYFLKIFGVKKTIKSYGN